MLQLDNDALLVIVKLVNLTDIMNMRTVCRQLCVYSDNTDVLIQLAILHHLPICTSLHELYKCSLLPTNTLLRDHIDDSRIVTYWLGELCPYTHVKQDVVVHCCLDVPDYTYVSGRLVKDPNSFSARLKKLKICAYESCRVNNINLLSSIIMSQPHHIRAMFLPKCLRIACSNSNVDIITYLFMLDKSNLLLDIQDELEYEVMRCRIQSVRDKYPIHYDDSLILCLLSRRLEIVKLIVDKVDINKLDRGTIISFSCVTSEIFNYVTTHIFDRYDDTAVMVSAALFGNVELIQRMLDKRQGILDKTLLEDVMVFAACDYKGIVNEEIKLGIVKWMMRLGCTNWNKTLINACGSGYISIINLMLNNGADDYDTSLIAAARSGHIEVVNMMIKLGATTFRKAMRCAIHGGNLGVVKILVKLCDDKTCRNMIIVAIDMGCVDIVMFLLDHTGNDIEVMDDAMSYAIQTDKKKIVDRMIIGVYKNYNLILVNAVINDRIEIILDAINCGASNIEEVIDMCGHRHELSEYLKSIIEV